VILDQFKLKGRVALVTGASAGLGQAIAVALAEAGADVACHGNTRTPDTTLEAISRVGRQAFAVAGDLGANSNTSGVLDAVAASQPQIFWPIGDFSYSQVTPEPA